jgi:hypothetical protein
MRHTRPVFLFTDFGWSGPYIGQMTTAIVGHHPQIPVISLMHDAPAMRPDLAAYLLAACCHDLPEGSVVVAVVDPGVGGERAALLVETSRLTFIGPDNGLLSRLPDIERVSRIDWRPPRLSASFHGRDLFAPAAARLLIGAALPVRPLDRATMVGADWPEDAQRVVFIDAYGNLMSGIDAAEVAETRHLRIGGQRIAHAETFSQVPPGELFWYANSLGLVEVAANGAAAAAKLSLALGDEMLLD